MAKYTVQDTSTGKNVTFEWNDPNPPTDQDMEQVFAQAKQMQPTERPSAGKVIAETAKDFYRVPLSLIEGMVSPITQTIAEKSPYQQEQARKMSEAVQPKMPVGQFLTKAVAYPFTKTAELEQAGLEKMGVPQSISPDLANLTSMMTLGGLGAAGSKISGAKTPITTAIPKVSEKLYASAVKMPLSKKWTQTLPGKELSDRKAAIKAGIEGKVPPSEYGISKATQIERETRGLVDEITAIGTVGGDSVKTADLLKGTDNAYRMAANSGDPRGAAAIIDSAVEKFMSRPGTITTQELTGIKRQLYKEAQDYTGEFKSIYDTTEKGIAHEAMIKLEDFYPKLRNLNAKDAAYIKLKEALESAVPRNQNKDIVGIGTKILANRSIPWAIWEATIGHPQVKARLAFALHEASKINKSKMATPIQKIGMGLGTPFSFEPQGETP